jgi:site-specific DNA-methyltransferase (adenine-specific)
MNKISSNILQGNCIEIMNGMEEETVDMIFADPPYNLSGALNMTVRSGKPVACHKGEWDIVEDLHQFNLKWLAACKRVLKPTGTLWVSGTLHNHPSIGMALKELGWWVINDVVWFKPNATPLLSRNRFVPSTELIWVASKTKKYYFDYALARKMNGGKQMRNMWIINAKRHVSSHPAEKPKELLERILKIGSKKDDVVLDPFVGSGTTGVVAKSIDRNFIGIEIDKAYVKISVDRIKSGE